MPQYKDKDGNKKEAPIIFPIKFGEKIDLSEALTEIHVLPVGEWNHPSYGKIKITSENIQEFITNFNKGIRNDVPITEGHESIDEKPAIGWFKQLIDKGSQGLWAMVEWTKEGKALLEQKAYKYFSPEFYQKYEDPETRQTFTNVLVGGALTNKPYFKELTAVVFSENSIINQFNEKTMPNLDEILKKDLNDLTDEDKKTLKENEGELTDEQKDTYKDVLVVKEEKKEEKKDNEEEDDDKKKKDNEEEDDDKVEGSEVKISAAELKILEEKADKGVKASEDLKKMKTEAIVNKFIFSESNKEGKILSKSKSKVVDFVLSLDENQAKQFSEILNELPKANLFGEVGVDGEGDGEDKKVMDEIDAKVNEKIKADDKLTYPDALKLVLHENPALGIRYNEEIKA